MLLQEIPPWLVFYSASSGGRELFEHSTAVLTALHIYLCLFVWRLVESEKSDCFTGTGCTIPVSVGAIIPLGAPALVRGFSLPERAT